ncbi:MAG: hypothetical protein Q8O56_03755 [Solirubrobacteraceae bacterium]|nr:hypothetical protein [Solirubrobacteraceae bacterium]
MTDAPAARPDDWPDPNDRTCDDCGHVWFAGERRHEYATFEAARPEEADVVCVLCRRQRERPRADDERWSGWEPQSP